MQSGETSSLCAGMAAVPIAFVGLCSPLGLRKLSVDVERFLQAVRQKTVKRVTQVEAYMPL